MTTPLRQAEAAQRPARPRRAAPVPSRVGAPDEFVPRTHLVRRLIAGRSAPLALIVAPAGYGKTALLAEWDRHDARPFAWHALEDSDNDPAELTRSLAAMVSELVAVRDDAPRAVDPRGGRGAASAPAQLRRTLRQHGRPCVLVLDDAQKLTAPEPIELLAALIEDLAEGSQIALASRTELALPVARLRAHRKLIEIRLSDLVMKRPDAALLARLSGVELDPNQLRDVVSRTEGWPAGLYLAALATKEGPDPEHALDDFAGDCRNVADYLREEFLDGMRPADVNFLVRSSVLDRLSGQLCDFVLERHDSARVLKRLSRLNLLLEPLDRTDTEYRYHRLLAEMLRGELRHREPEDERLLHGRASDWYAEQGEPASAVDHAIAAGDVRRAGALLWERAPEFISYGQGHTVREWLGRFTDDQIAAAPALALTAACSHLALGELTPAEQWATAASNGLASDPPGDRRDELAGAVLIVRAVGAPEGVVRMGEDAARAYEMEPDGGWWRAVACLLQGAAAHLTGRREDARTWLEEGARRGASCAPGIQVLCQAQLVLHAIERDDWSDAEVQAARAKAQVERISQGDCALSALVHAVSADVLARFGRVEEAQRDIDQAALLLTQLSDFAPWFGLECRIAAARAALRLSDSARARQLLSDAAWCRRQVPDASVAREWFDETSVQLKLTAGRRGSDGWSLTTAELRVLQFLPTHLSFPEIASRLYVSANTVKTHARAVYRKLDASSRGEAVLRAREAGLLDRYGRQASSESVSL
jgi:LuxR family maltose regulon positive regulatory protein